MSVRTDGAASLTLAVSVAVTTWCLSLGAAAEPTLQFRTWQLSSRFYCEGADFGDFNDDGQVDGADFGGLLAAWGSCSAPCQFDLNSDGEVNGADIGLMLSYWGGCP